MRSISTPIIETLTHKEINEIQSFDKKSMKKDGKNEMEAKLKKIKAASENLDA